MTAPLRTPTSRRSLPSYSAPISAASSSSLAWICSSVMRTFSRSAPMWAASTAQTPLCVGSGGRAVRGYSTRAGGAMDTRPSDRVARSGPGRLTGPCPCQCGEECVAGLGMPRAHLSGRRTGREGEPPPDPGAHRRGAAPARSSVGPRTGPEGRERLRRRGRRGGRRPPAGGRPCGPGRPRRPGPRSRSRSARARRARTRVKAGSSFIGSSHQVQALVRRRTARRLALGHAEEGTPVAVAGPRHTGEGAGARRPG